MSSLWENSVDGVSLQDGGRNLVIRMVERTTGDAERPTRASLYLIDDTKTSRKR